MSQTVLDKAADHIADTAYQASRATKAVADAIEDGVGVAKCAAKHAGDAAEEFVTDTTRRIQRNAVLAAATTFVVGLTVGTAFGLMTKRR